MNDNHLEITMTERRINELQEQKAEINNTIEVLENRLAEL